MAKADPQAAGQAYAVIVVGATGSPMYARHYADRVARFSKVLTDAGLAKDRLIVIPADSAATVITDTLTKAAASPAAEDQFILILIGHGAVSEAGVQLMVPGPDLSIATVADVLKSVKCKNQIVLNFSGSSGDAMRLLSKPGRVNIASSLPGQVNDNDFAEFVLQELERTDSKSKTMLDVYNCATQNYARWIVRQRMPQVEGAAGWTVEGRESASIFKRLYDGPDIPANLKFVPSTVSDSPDVADPPLFPNNDAHWTGRRLISESPAIDDSGTFETTPDTAITEKGFAPVTVSPSVGAVAAGTVIGRPGLVKSTTQPTTAP